jgi:hypothetical protein
MLVQPPVHIIGTLWEWPLTEKLDHVLTGNYFSCEEQLGNFLNVFTVNGEEVFCPLVCVPTCPN